MVASDLEDVSEVTTEPWFPSHGHARAPHR